MTIKQAHKALKTLPNVGYISVWEHQTDYGPSSPGLSTDITVFVGLNSGDSRKVQIHGKSIDSCVNSAIAAWHVTEANRQLTCQTCGK